MKCLCDHPEKYGHASHCVYYEIDRLRGLLREAIEDWDGMDAAFVARANAALAGTADQPPVVQDDAERYQWLMKFYGDEIRKMLGAVPCCHTFVLHGTHSVGCNADNQSTVARKCKHEWNDEDMQDGWEECLLCHDERRKSEKQSG